MAAGISFQLFESLTPAGIVAALAVFTLSSFIVDFARKPRYPDDLPRVGCGDGGLLSTLRNCFLFITRYNSWVTEGYEKVTEHAVALVSARH
jgi:hypothetical protein